MFGHRLPADRKVTGNVRDRRFLSRSQHLDDLAPGGVRQGIENTISSAIATSIRHSSGALRAKVHAALVPKTGMTSQDDR